MAAFRNIAALLALLALVGCFASKEALIGDDAVADYASLTFTAVDEDDAEPQRFTREGNGYVLRDDGEEVSLHLKPVAGDYYVAELAGKGSDGSQEYLYGYIKLDVPAGHAEVWLMFGSPADVRPGLSACDAVICIEDLAAYIAYGQEKVASGAEPDAAFTVVAE